MNIALDYDGTFTEDPIFWLRFILECQQSGHDLRVVTMRYPSEQFGEHPMDERIVALGVPIVFTSRKAKAPVLKELGWHASVWIDDNPKAVDNDAAQVWPGPTTPEGQPVVPTHG